MAAVAKSGNPSLSTLTPGSECWVGSNLFAGEDLGYWDACYIKSDGSVWRSIGTSANAAAKVRGYAATPAKSGMPVSLMKDVDVNYGSGLTPGADYFLDTAAGGLSTVATTGGTASIAYAVDTTRIRMLASRY